MPRRKPGRWARQAALEALLRFSPEASGLSQLQRAAERRFTQDVQGAQATERGTIQAVRQARPEVRGIYNRAARTTGRINAVVGQDMAGVPASLQAAMAQEQAGFGRRLAESRADALTGLTERRVAATEGRGAAESAARTQFATTLEDVLARRISLARERGTFTALRTGELRQAAQQRADEWALANLQLSAQERESIRTQRGQDRRARRAAEAAERRSLRSSGVDPDTGRPIPGGRLDPDANNRPGDQSNGGGGGATNAQRAAAQDVVGDALGWIKRLRRADLHRPDIARALLEGREGVALHDPATGRPRYDANGRPVTTSEVPKIGHQLLLSAALDQVFDGHVSRKNARLLRKRGIRPKDLGLTSFREWRQDALNYPAPRT